MRYTIMITFPTCMEQSMEQQRKYVLEALAEETYLTAEQRQQLQDLVIETDKQVVLDTVEDLVHRLIVQRTENSILILRKIQNALRLEGRRATEQKELQEQGEIKEAMEQLLHRIPS